MTSTPVYRAIVVELERKRQAMGMSMDRASEIIGAERSWSKLLYPDTSSGRQASWEKLQRAVDAMYPDGFEVIIRAGETKTDTTPGTKRLIRSSAAHYDRRTQRELMREIGKMGGKASASVKKKQPPKWKRIARARRAAKRRWATPKIVEITGTSAAKIAML
jgi:hypothetical protein